MGGCQNYGPFLGTLNIRCRIIIGIQKGTIILTTTHMEKTRSEATESAHGAPKIFIAMRAFGFRVEGRQAGDLGKKACSRFWQGGFFQLHAFPEGSKDRDLGPKYYR